MRWAVRALVTLIGLPLGALITANWLVPLALRGGLLSVPECRDVFFKIAPNPMPMCAAPTFPLIVLGGAVLFSLVAFFSTARLTRYES